MTLLNILTLHSLSMRARMTAIGMHIRPRRPMMSVLRNTDRKSLPDSKILAKYWSPVNGLLNMGTPGLYFTNAISHPHNGK